MQHLPDHRSGQPEGLETTPTPPPLERPERKHHIDENTQHWGRRKNWGRAGWKGHQGWPALTSHKNDSKNAAGGGNSLLFEGQTMTGKPELQDKKDLRTPDNAVCQRSCSGRSVHLLGLLQCSRFVFSGTYQRRHSDWVLSTVNIC